MKKVLYLLSIGVITLLALSGCSKENVEPEYQEKTYEVQRYAKLNGFLLTYSGKYDAYSYDANGEMILDDCIKDGVCSIIVSKKSSAYNAKKWDIDVSLEKGKTFSFSINTDELFWNEKDRFDEMIFDFSEFETSLPQKEKLQKVDIEFDMSETNERTFWCGISYINGTSNVTNYYIEGIH